MQLLQLNLAKNKYRVDVLINWAIEKSIDCLLLQEVPDRLTFLNCTSCLPVIRPTTVGAYSVAIILLNNDILFEQVVEFDSPYYVEIAAELNGQKFHIASCYNNVTATDSLETLTKRLIHVPEYYVVGMDSNGRHISWDKISNTMGKKVKAILDDGKLVVLNSKDTPTHLNIYTEDTAIDLTAVSKNTCPFVLNWEVLPRECAIKSDHLPLLTTLFSQVPSVLSTTVVMMDIIVEKIEKIEADLDLSQLTSLLLILRETCSKTVPLKSNSIFTEKILLLQMEKNRLKNIWLDDKSDNIKRSAFMLARNSFVSAVKEAKTNHYGSIVKAKTAEAWKKLSDERLPCYSKLVTENEVISDVDKIGELIMNAKFPDGQSFQVISSNSKVTDDPITLAELLDAAKKLKNDISSGPVKISVRLVKHLVKSNPYILLRAINNEFSEGRFSNSLKVLKATILPKSDNQFLKINEFRVVLSAPILAKLYELVLLERLVYYIKKDFHLYSKSQYAFWKGSSSRLMLRDIKNFLNQNDVIIFVVDICSAFESIDLTELVKILIGWNLPWNLFSALQQYLRNREVKCLKKNKKDYITRTQYKGVSQGSMLAPLLWNIYANAILCKMDAFKSSSNCLNLQWRVYGYCDDWVIGFKIINTNDDMVKEVNMVCDKLIHLINEHGLSISPSKTVLMCRSAVLWTTFYDNFKFKVVPTVKILGVIFGSLDFREQVDHVVAETLTALKPYTGPNGIYLNKFTKNLLVKNRLMQILLHAAEVWSDAISITSYYDLKSVHLKLMRFNMGSRNFMISYYTALMVCQEMEISYTLWLRRAKFRLLDHTCVFSPINLVYDCSLFDKLNAHPAEQLPCEIVLVDRGSDLGNEDHHSIYVDGSVRDGWVGAAFVHYDRGQDVFQFVVGLKSCFTSFDAEFYALEQAVLYAIDKKLCCVHIITDCQGVLMMLSNRSSNNERRLNLLHKMKKAEEDDGQIFVLKWVRSHGSTWGNLLVDVLAKQGTTADVIADIPATIEVAKKWCGLIAEKAWLEKALRVKCRATPLFRLVDKRFGIMKPWTNNLMDFVAGVPYYLKTSISSNKKEQERLCECKKAEQTLAHLIYSCPLMKESVQDICNNLNVPVGGILNHENIFTVIKELDDLFRSKLGQERENIQNKTN